MSAGLITHYRDVISGRRRGMVAAAMRSLLAAAASPYAVAVRRRNRRFDQGITPTYRAAVPVISVGNLTVGGTGKTPLVLWLVRWFREHDVAAAVVSRGYRAAHGAPNDEAMELEQRAGGLVHCQNPDRVAAIQLAVKQGAQVIVLDDGFQHRRVVRDLDIVLVDALEPFGHGYLLPRGLLREPLDALARADVIGLSRADAVSAERRDQIRDQLQAHCPNGTWTEIVHQPLRLLGAGQAEQSIQWLRGKRIAAFCGIGNPSGFRHTLDQCGCHTAAFREFPDHHAYAAADLDRLANSFAQEPALDAVVCTHKDLVKIERRWLGALPLWAVAVDIHMSDEGLAIEAMLRPLLERLNSPTG